MSEKLIQAASQNPSESEEEKPVRRTRNTKNKSTGRFAGTVTTVFRSGHNDSMVGAPPIDPQTGMPVEAFQETLDSVIEAKQGKKKKSNNRTLSRADRMFLGSPPED